MTKEIVSREEVSRIAILAKLTLTPREKAAYSHELSAILDYFRIIDRVEDDGVPSSFSATEVTNSFRDESVIVTDPEPILSGVPKRKGRYVKAPRVF